MVAATTVSHCVFLQFLNPKDKPRGQILLTQMPPSTNPYLLHGSRHLKTRPVSQDDGFPTRTIPKATSGTDTPWMLSWGEAAKWSSLPEGNLKPSLSNLTRCHQFEQGEWWACLHTDVKKGKKSARVQNSSVFQTSCTFLCCFLHSNGANIKVWISST